MFRFILSRLSKNVQGLTMALNAIDDETSYSAFEIEQLDHPAGDENNSLGSTLLKSPLNQKYSSSISSINPANTIGPADGPSGPTRRKSSLAQFVEQKKASIFSSMMNLSNTILGAGLLGLPYAISKTGYILSFILFIVMAILSFIGLNLSCSAAKIKAPNASYYTLSDLSVPRAKKLVDFAVAIKCFGVGTAYFVVIGDLMPDVLKGIHCKLIASNYKFKYRIFAQTFGMQRMVKSSFMDWNLLSHLHISHGTLPQNGCAPVYFCCRGDLLCLCYSDYCFVCGWCVGSG